MLKLVLLSITASAALADTPLPTPNPIYDGGDYSEKLASVPNGVLYEVSAPDAQPLKVMHVFGSARERGYAHGQLLSADIVDFVVNELDDYYRSEVTQIPVASLPQWLQKLVKSLEPVLEKAAPTVFNAALRWVWSQQVKYINASQTRVLDEMAGIVDGVCAPAGSNKTVPKLCEDKAKMLRTMYNVNMLPELVQMQCSMMGAWGDATPDGKLTQMRTLDFGGGPFADRSILVVHHPSDTDHEFAALSFPGFVGIVTGFSKYLAQSEKVDDVTGGRRPKGSYDGQAVAMVIRDMVQLAKTKEEAVSIAQAAKRTWSVWLGLGDFHSQEFTAMLYDQASATPYDDTTLPTLTNQTAFKHVAYIDKHPQPSPHPDMPALVQEYYGKLDAKTVAQNFPRGMQSGDVHVAVYDFSKSEVMFSFGTTDGPTGNYTRKACNAPFVRFGMESLWSEKKPADDQ